MIKKTIYPPRFITGIEYLHQQLYEAHLKGAQIANRLLGTPKPDKGKLTTFYIYVDFAETQPENKIKGYFSTKYKVLRLLPIEFDISLLFPVVNHGGGTFKKANGILYEDVKNAKYNRIKTFYRFTPVRPWQIQHNKILYNIKSVPNPILSSFSQTVQLDDIGCPFYSFPDLKELALVNINPEIQNNKYSLVGKQYYAPLTISDDIDCVLFAELDNPYDDNAIKVLRWFPVKKGKEIEQRLGLEPEGGDVFFELGYISRKENSNLHRFMVETNSRILFGNISNDKISIAGGVKIFQTNDIKYPKCLYNIKLV